jgi:hypothetical protein
MCLIILSLSIYSKGRALYIMPYNAEHLVVDISYRNYGTFCPSME